jgi:hypothetical protein
MSSRLIPTPFHTLWLAELLGFGGRTVDTTDNVIVEDEEEILFSRVFSIHGVLAVRTGTAADVCALLCSLLCGLGFEEFVCGKKVLSIHLVGADVRSTNLEVVGASSTLVNAITDAVCRNRRDRDRE